MKLSTRTQYGLRFLIHLAINAVKGPMQLKEIAEKERISDKYLEQIIISLKPSGIIKSLRGANGGYTLAKNADQITLKDIYIALEGGIEITGEKSDDKSAQTTVNATASNIWTTLENTLSRYLSSVTLGDIAKTYFTTHNNEMYYI